MYSVLNMMEEEDVDRVFAEPVKDSDAPGYSEIIKVPMDLSTIRTKIGSKLYESLKDFHKDLRQMFDNCELYNEPRSKPWNTSKRLRKLVSETKIAGGTSSVSASASSRAADGLPEGTRRSSRHSSGTTDHPTSPARRSSRARSGEASRYDEDDDDAHEGDDDDEDGQSTSESEDVRPRKRATREDRSTDVRSSRRSAKKKRDSRGSDSDSNEDTAADEYEVPAAPLAVADDRLNRGAKRMNRETKALMYRVLNSLDEADEHKLFAEPVTDDIAPEYSTVCPNPMDLSTLRGKLGSRKYAGLEDFTADVMLMFDNCERYNEPNSEVYNTSRELRRLAQDLLRS
jgi:hypothetical protein